MVEFEAVLRMHVRCTFRYRKTLAVKCSIHVSRDFCTSLSEPGFKILRAFALNEALLSAQHVYKQIFNTPKRTKFIIPQRISRYFTVQLINIEWSQ